MNAFSMFGVYVRTSIKAQLQYKADFLLMTLGAILDIGVQIYGISVLFARFGHLDNWSFVEVTLLFGFANLAFGITDILTRGIDVFHRLIKNGHVDRLLLRPRSILLQLMGYEFRINRLGRILPGLIALFVGIALTYSVWGVLDFLLLIWSLINCILLFAGMLLMQATIVVFSTESVELVNAITYGGIQVASYPMSIYRDWFRNFFIFIVPLALVSYFPLAHILDKGVMAPVLCWILPVGGLVFFLLMLLLFQKVGLRNYRSTGT